MARRSVPALAATLLLALALAPAAAAPPSAAHEGGWMIADATVEAATDHFSVRTRGSGETPGAVVAGVGVAMAPPGRPFEPLGVWAIDIGHEHRGVALEVLAESARVRVDVAPAAGTSFALDVTFHFLHVGNLVTGERGHFDLDTRAAMLVFVPDARIDAWLAEPERGAAAFDLASATGAGAATVNLHEGEGVAARATHAATPPEVPRALTWPVSGASAGDVRVARELGAGAVGAIGNVCVAACDASWRSPVGAGSYAEVDRVYTQNVHGHPAFAGPGGAWEWTWRGASRSHAFAAYALVGERWTDFATEGAAPPGPTWLLEQWLGLS